MASPEVRISGPASAEDLTGDDVEMVGSEVIEVIEVVDTGAADGDEAENGTAEADEPKPEAQMIFVE